MPIKTKTNILATLGPSSATKEVISKLIDAGADAFRFNFSHGTHDEHKERYNIVRKLAKEKGRRITLIADMQGPKLRVGEFKEGKILLKEGQKFLLDMDKELGDEKRVTLPHPEIFAAVKNGEELLLNDGNIRLKIEKHDQSHIWTKVTVGGELSSHKGVNLPNITLPISAITEKDKKDIAFALKLGFDWISLSFIQKAEDVKQARNLIGDKALIISKLEKPSAITELDEIVKLSDGIMVARGDLGVECPIQQVPVLQKRIVSCCRKYARPVIVATQMLESMINNPTPTRAEVSDVATAVYDGADTVMLSAESAAGHYPVEAVQMMNNIITEVESDPLFYKLMDSSRQDHPCCVGESDSITYAASEVSAVLKNVAAIVTYSSSGLTTFLASRERPSLPILAITPNETVANRLGIAWGVDSFVNKKIFSSFDKFEEEAVRVAVENGYAKSGDHIIITAGFPIGKKGRTNMLHTVYIP